MTDSKIACIIKAHYDHTTYRPLSSYCTYIGSQVTRRVGDDINSEPIFKGVKFSNKELIDGVFSGNNNYLDYISNRKGSTGMFTDPRTNLASVFEDARSYSGYYFMPYISMRESDARKYGVLTRQDFERVVVAAMREMPDILRIHERDFRYLAAFHMKPKEKQNNNGAGKQPHIHLIMWDQSSDRRKFKMSEREISQFRSVVYKHLFSKHRIQFYTKRNNIRKSIMDEVAKLLDDDVRFRNELERIKNSLYKIRNGSGSLHYGTLLKEFDFLKINDKTHNTEKDFFSRNINLEMTIHQYDYFFDTIGKLANEIFKHGDLPNLLRDWHNVSYQMREYEGEKISRESTESDFTSLLNVVFNKIIRVSAYQTEIVRDPMVLREVTYLIEKGVLKYKRIDPNIGMELARIMFRATFFKHDGDYTKMRRDINSLYMLFKDVINDNTYFYHYHRELQAMNALKSPGLFMEELELIGDYIETENTYHYPKGYPTHLSHNEWMSVDAFGLTIHSRKESAISKYVNDYKKLEATKHLESSRVLLEKFKYDNELKQKNNLNLSWRKSNNLQILSPLPVENSQSNGVEKKKKLKPIRAPKKLDDFEKDQELIEKTIEDGGDLDIDFVDDEYEVSKGAELGG